MREYRQSKLANLLFSVELDRRIRVAGDQVLSVAVQPGANKTDLTRHLSEAEIAEGMKPAGWLYRTLAGCFIIPVCRCIA